jgi:uncharacterized repeat protein (TIGR02543 family)
VRLAADASGGSGGIDRVSFNAKVDGEWRNVNTDSSAPFEYDWDLSGVGRQTIELGMTVWDRSGNQWEYSQHYTNISFNNQRPDNCGGTGSGTWTAKYYDTDDHWWDPNNTGWYVCEERDIPGPSLNKDYGSGSPRCGGFRTGDHWTADFQGTFNFPAGDYVFHADHDDGYKLWVEGLNNGNPIDESGGKAYSHACNGQQGYHLEGTKRIRVVLHEEGGDAKISMTWNTDTSQCPRPTPPIPTLNTPTNGSTQPPNYDLTFQWNTAANASEYLLEWWGGPYTAMQPCGWNSSTACHVGQVIPGHTYSWRVKARNASGESDWSPTWTFTVAERAIRVDRVALEDSAGNETSTVRPGDRIGLVIYATNTSGRTQPSYWWWRVENAAGQRVDGMSYDNWPMEFGTGGSTRITLPNTVPVLPAGTYTFIGTVRIGEDSDSKQSTFTVNAPPCYTLALSWAPAGSGTISANPPPNCPSDNTKYLAGASVQLTASPNSGYTFANWSGAVTGSNNPVTLTMDSDKSVTANFTAPPPCYTLAIGANPSGGGAVARNQGPNCPSDNTKYTSGTPVQLTANPNSGYAFANWSGDASGSANPTMITMNGNKTVTANFTPVQMQVNLLLDPAAPTVAPGQIFELTIRAQAGSQNVTSVGIEIDFDRERLRVVDSNGAVANTITAGPNLVVRNIANNSTGHISYDAATISGDGLPATGDFVIASIRLKAVGASGATQVRFAAGTDVLWGEASVLGNMINSTVTIQDSPFRGRVTLQARGSPPDTRWQGFPLRVELHTGSCSNAPIASYDVATDASGNFSVPNTPSGIYYVRVKNSHTLSMCKPSVVLPYTDVVDFGTLLEGDANNDDQVRLLDLSILSYVYYTCQGEARFDPRADFNGDGCVRLIDLSLLASNYYKQGPIMTSGEEQGQVSSERVTAE